LILKNNSNTFNVGVPGSSPGGLTNVVAVFSAILGRVRRAFLARAENMAEAEITLIGSATSPFVRKARIVAARLAVPVTFKLEAQWSPDSALYKNNPLAKVPTLIAADCEPLYDSRVIVAELERRAGRSLRPHDPKDNIIDQRIEALADGIGEAVALSVQETWRPEGRRSQIWKERQWSKIERGVMALASDRSAGRLDSNLATVGAIAAACALGFLSFWFPQEDWGSTSPELAAWFRKWSEDPDFAATAPVLRPDAKFPML
jgi:glutathione S-transferase